MAHINYVGINASESVAIVDSLKFASIRAEVFKVFLRRKFTKKQWKFDACDALSYELIWRMVISIQLCVWP